MPNSELITPNLTVTSTFYRLYKCYYILFFFCACVFLGNFIGTRCLYVPEVARASNPWKWSYRHSQQPDMDAGNLTLGTL